MDKELLELIRQDMKPALGVTEPAAIALACAKARSLTDEAVQSVQVSMNSGIYKNAFTCGIPGTTDVGNEYSAALGVVCGDADKELLVLENVDETAVEAARAMVREGKVRVHMESVDSAIRIAATVRTANDECTAVIQGSHTNFVLLKKNGEVLFEKEVSDHAQEQSPITGYTVSQIVAFAKNVPAGELSFIREAYRINLELAQRGRQWDRCVITDSLYKENGNTFFSDDAQKSAKTLACAAAEARVLGTDLPAMSITGSGTHGIICTLPLYGYTKVRKISEEELLRATAISYLICMYMKEFSGKLSAFCGCGIAGGTGLACALCYLLGGDETAIEATCNNMAASITGMICTGGNHCCTLKVAGAIDCAFTSAKLAADGASIAPPHGIIDTSVEKTLQNVGLIADPGMTGTEKTIVEIMQDKRLLA